MASQGKRCRGLLPVYRPPLPPVLGTPGAPGSGLSLSSTMCADISQPHDTSWCSTPSASSPDRRPGHQSPAGLDQKWPTLSQRLHLSPKPGVWSLEQHNSALLRSPGLGDSSGWAPCPGPGWGRGKNLRAPLRDRAKTGRERLAQRSKGGRALGGQG